MNKKPFNALNDCFVRYFFTDKGGEKVLLDFINAVMISADMKTFKAVEILNPFNLKITKTNEHGKVLKGAEFTLYSDADCKNVVDTQTSDDKGLLTFKNLDVEKTYYFKETKAPQGYRIPVDENGQAYVHSVYVKATPQNNAFDFTIDNVQYNTSKTSGNIRLEGTKNDRVVAVDITNKTTQLLPETGSNGTILLIGLGVAVIAFALYMSKKEKLNSK